MAMIQSPSYVLQVLGFLVGFCVAAGFLFRRTNLYKCCASIPYFSITSVLYNVKDWSFFISNPTYEILLKIAKKFQEEGIFVLWAVRPIIFIYNPEYTKILLTSTDALDRSIEYLAFNPWAMSGLANCNGEKWVAHRKVTNYAFYSSLLQDYAAMINEHTEILVKKMKALAQEPWFDVLPIMNLCAMDIICELVLGTKMDAQNHAPDGMKFAEAFGMAVETISHRIERPWTLYEKLFNFFPSGRKQLKYVKFFQEFNQKAIDDRCRTLLEENSSSDPSEKSQALKKACLLNVLLEAHRKDPSFTMKHVVEEVNSFMLAGNNATPQILSWVLLLLGLHPETQKKVAEEMDNIFGEDQERPVTTEDLSKMKYLECVIKETLRMYPGAPLISRTLRENVQVGKYTIPPSTSVIFFLHMMHMDPRTFPNPEKFDPDRFLPENSSTRHPCCFLPFSFGPRNCLAQKFAMMEMKIILSSVIRNFIVTSLDSRKTVGLNWLLALRNRNPVRLSLTPR